MLTRVRTSSRLTTQYRQINIAVVGAGTGGCASSLFLSSKHNVTMFERVQEPQSIGAGLLLQPTGMYALGRLNLLYDIKQKGTKIHELFAENANNRKLFHLKYSTLHPKIFGLGIHRGELFAHLYNAVRNNENIVKNIGVDITGIERSDKGSYLITTESKHGPFDLVVVADGARSRLCRTDPSLSNLVRRHRVYSWGTLWFVAKDPDNYYGHTLHQKVRGTTKMLGILPNGHHDGCRVVSMFWSVPRSIKHSWKDIDLEYLKQEILYVAPNAKFLVDQLKSIDQLTFADYYDTILQKPYNGNVVVIGDACHAMSPQLGNGANLALWDSMMLSDAIDEEQNKVSNALDRFANERKPHIWFYGTCSRLMTPYFQSNSKILGWERDAFLGPLSSIPIFNRQMTIILSGVRRGLFNKYDLEPLAKMISEEENIEATGTKITTKLAI